MTTLIVKIMNTLLHTQPGNLTKEVGLLHIILLPMIVQCQGRQISVNKLDMVAAYAGTAHCIPEMTRTRSLQSCTAARAQALMMSMPSEHGHVVVRMKALAS